MTEYVIRICQEDDILRRYILAIRQMKTKIRRDLDDFLNRHHQIFASDGVYFNVKIILADVIPSVTMLSISPKLD